MLANLSREGVTLTNAAGLDVWSMPVLLWHGPKGFDSSFTPENKPHHTIAVRLSGCLVQRVDARRTSVEKLAADGFSIHPAGYDLRFIAKSEIRFAHLPLSEVYLRNVLESFNRNARQSNLLRDDRVMFRDDGVRHQIATYIDRAFDEDDPPCGLEMDSRAALIALDLIKRLSSLGRIAPIGDEGGKLAPWQVRTVCDFMNARLNAAIRLGDLATLVGTSEEHFCRAFRRSVGLPPYRWLQKRRIAQSQVLMSDRGLSLTDIAQRVGYAGQSAFGAAFRKETGMTPSQFRRSV